MVAAAQNDDTKMHDAGATQDAGALSLLLLEGGQRRSLGETNQQVTQNIQDRIARLLEQLSLQIHTTGDVIVATLNYCSELNTIFPLDTLRGLDHTNPDHHDRIIGIYMHFLRFMEISLDDSEQGVNIKNAYQAALTAIRKDLPQDGIKWENVHEAMWAGLLTASTSVCQILMKTLDDIERILPSHNGLPSQHSGEIPTYEQLRTSIQTIFTHQSTSLPELLARMRNIRIDSGGGAVLTTQEARRLQDREGFGFRKQWKHFPTLVSPEIYTVLRVFVMQCLKKEIAFPYLENVTDPYTLARACQQYLIYTHNLFHISDEEKQGLLAKIIDTFSGTIGIHITGEKVSVPDFIQDPMWMIIRSTLSGPFRDIRKLTAKNLREVFWAVKNIQPIGDPGPILHFGVMDILLHRTTPGIPIDAKIQTYIDALPVAPIPAEERVNLWYILGLQGEECFDLKIFVPVNTKNKVEFLYMVAMDRIRGQLQEAKRDIRPLGSRIESNHTTISILKGQPGLIVPDALVEARDDLYHDQDILSVLQDRISRGEEVLRVLNQWQQEQSKKK